MQDSTDDEAQDGIDEDGEYMDSADRKLRDEAKSVRKVCRHNVVS